MIKATITRSEIRVTSVVINDNSLKYEPVISYVDLAAKVEYVDPRADSFLNASNKHVWLIDGPGHFYSSVTLSDSLSKSLTKPIDDSVVADDVAANSVNKVLGDSVTPSDAIANSVNKAVSDSVTPTDTVALALGALGTGAINGSSLDSSAMNDQQLLRYTV